MGDLQTLTPDMPIPAVDAGDLRVAWKVFDDLQKTQPPGAQGSAAAASMNIIARQCSPGANALAVVLRCLLIALLMKQSILEPWVHNGEIDAKVFEALAAVPLPKGFDGVDLDDIAARLNSL